MTPHNETIRYTFTLPDGERQQFDLELDGRTFQLLPRAGDPPPAWTDLEFRKCPNCPLSPSSHPRCPLAVNLAPIVHRFDGLLSYDDLGVEVVTGERWILQHTSAQRAIGSLMGLVIAASGCPHSAFLRPMARFHLPFANREETVYRATSMYLLAQFFVRRSGGAFDVELEGLRARYREMQTVNAAIVKRVAAATATDSSVNALIVLDAYAKTLEMVIDESLERIAHWFSPYTTGRA